MPDNLLPMLNKFFELEKAVHNAFGYEENWVKIPLEDSRDCYWMHIVEKLDHVMFISGDEPLGGTIVCSPDPLTAEAIVAGSAYSYDIYTQRFLSKWIYRTREFTLACVDPRSDGNKYLSIFDNAKEQTDENLKEVWTEWWSDEAIMKRLEASKRLENSSEQPANS